MYTKKNSDLPSSITHSVDFDISGNVWVGTNEGAALFDGSSWVVYDESTSDIISGDINDISVAGPQEIWFATAKGLSRMQNGTWTNFAPSTSDLPEKYISSIATGSEGNKWLGTQYNGPVKFDNTDFITYSDTTLMNNDINDFVFDLNDKLWIACYEYYSTKNGIATLDGGDSQQLTPANSDLPTDNVWYLEVDSKNNIWGLGYLQLLKYDSIWHDANGSLPCESLSDFFVAPGDSVWICYQGTNCPAHSVFYDTANVKNFVWNVCPDNCTLINRPTADSEGNLWFNSFSGCRRHTKVFGWPGANLYPLFL